MTSSFFARLADTIIEKAIPACWLCAVVAVKLSFITQNGGYMGTSDGHPTASRARAVQEKTIEASPTPSATMTPSPTPFFARPSLTPEPRFEPVNLRIEKLGIDTTVEHVGLTEERAMDTPKDPWNVAWLATSYSPGQTGSAVIAGHLDTETGPAIFANLAQLVPGDVVEVRDAAGSVLQFRVIEVANYTADAFPFEEVFEAHDAKRLNLITCAGTFNTSGPGYSHRTVVYTQL